MSTGKSGGNTGGKKTAGARDMRVKVKKAGKLKRIPFADRAAMKKLADPVMADYAKEIGAEAIYNKINSM